MAFGATLSSLTQARLPSGASCRASPEFLQGLGDGGVLRLERGQGGGGAGDVGGLALQLHDLGDAHELGRAEIAATPLDRVRGARQQRRVRSGDGRFELLGRADRIVKVEERRISLDAIEARLRESEWVDEVRLVALPGRRVLLAAVAMPTTEGRALLDAEALRLRRPVTRALAAELFRPR